jgi:hypothetical protein
LRKKVKNKAFTRDVNNALRAAFEDEKKSTNEVRQRRKAEKAQRKAAGEKPRLKIAEALLRREELALDDALCCVCEQAVIDWLNCGNEDCGAVMHFMCLVLSVMERSIPRMLCPGCEHTMRIDMPLRAIKTVYRQYHNPTLRRLLEQTGVFLFLFLFFYFFILLR